MNRPGSAEALGCESRCHIDVVCGSILLILGFDRRDVADGLQQPAMVEPVDPFEGRVLDGFEAAPRSALVDHLGFVEAVDRLCQSVVVAVADTADRRLDAGLGEALGVFVDTYWADSTGRRNVSQMEAWDGHQEAAFESMHPAAITVSRTAAGRQSGRAWTVLAVCSGRDEQRGGRGEGRSVTTGWQPLVPGSGWYATGRVQVVG